MIRNGEDEVLKSLYSIYKIPWIIKGEESKVYEINLGTLKITQERNDINDNILVNYFGNNLTKNYLKWPGVIFVEKNARITTDMKPVDPNLPEVYQFL